MQRAQAVLQNTFGYDQFRHSQKEAIEAVLNGADAFVLMPTGGGKSLCYQIPALVLEGTAIVISPLIALMQDQVDALLQLGVRAAFLNSSMSGQQAAEVEQQLLLGALDLLYVAPERLLSARMLSLLDQSRLSLFAIDEAHCVSHWGHDFRPEYQQLRLLHERYPSVPRLALTATADQRTQQEIVAQLALDEAQIFINSFDRPNIHYSISEGNNPKQRLWYFLEEKHPEDAGIVYCLSRKKVEAIAEWLVEQGRIALPYHAGLSAEVRQRNQQRFLREEGVIVVATIAFGMGIDKPDVRFVAHLSLPKSVEAYYQETGRGGRDGQPASAWMAYGLQDVITLRQFVQNSDADELHKRVEHQKLDSMLGLCELVSCRRHALLEYFQESSEAQCGNCDNCVAPPETWNASVVAQKALSAIYRSGQGFGFNYIINILRGKSDTRIEQNGHDRLTTFGVGKELSASEWRVVLRQLLALGYLQLDEQGYGALHLADKCRPLLKGEEQLKLRKLAKEPQSKIKGKQQRAIRPQDQLLWDALRALRGELAAEAGVPPYVIFHDATLQAMLSSRPTTAESLRAISGVGEQKLSRYGRQFLAVIAEHPLSGLLNNRLSPTTNETLVRYQQGMGVAEIAKQREVTDSTVYTHLAEAIEVGLLQAREVLNLQGSDYDEIVMLIESLDDGPKGRLKPVYEALEARYAYGVLRCVQASVG